MTTEHPRPTDVAGPREAQHESPGPVQIDQTQAGRSRTRALAALAVLAAVAGAYAWYRDTAADTARQVLVYRDQLQCRGDDVRVGSNRIDVSGPDVACTGNVEIHNDSGRAVHLSTVTFAFAGPANSHPVIVTSIDGDPDVDSDGKQGVEAGLDLDLDVAAGTFIRVSYEVGTTHANATRERSSSAGGRPSASTSCTTTSTATPTASSAFTAPEPPEPAPLSVGNA